MTRNFRSTLKAAIGPVLIAAVVTGFMARPSPIAANDPAQMNQLQDKPWSFGVIGDT